MYRSALSPNIRSLPTPWVMSVILSFFKWSLRGVSRYLLSEVPETMISLHTIEVVQGQANSSQEFLYILYIYLYDIHSLTLC